MNNYPNRPLAPASRHDHVRGPGYRQWICIATLALLSFTGEPAAAEEQLSLPRPLGWVPARSLALPLIRLSEFSVPADPGQPEGARDQLSFEWYANALAASIDPLELAEQTGRNLRAGCSGAERIPVFAGFERGFPTAVTLFTCPERDDGVADVILMKHIQGDTGSWIIVRGRAIPPTVTEDSGDDGARSPLSQADMAIWARFLRDITVCNPDDAEHPCPDTTD